jgi:hypothetical protein
MLTPVVSLINGRTVAEAQRMVTKWGKPNAVSRLFHGKIKTRLPLGRQDLDRILHVFDVRSVSPVRRLLRASFQAELLMNNHMVLLDLHRNALIGQVDNDGRDRSVSATFYSSTKKIIVSRLEPGL